MLLDNYFLYKGAWIFTHAPHLSKALDKNECSVLLSKGGYFIRNTYDFDCIEETRFWYVIKDKFNGMDELSTKVRNQVRRSKNRLEIKIITKEKMLNEGYEINKAAFESYKVKTLSPDRKSFIERINSCGNDFDFWGCIDKETSKLVAFSINQILDNQCNYQTFKAIPEYLKSSYPYYGLLFEMNNYYLNVLKLNYVNDVSRSITEHSNIQPFLIDKFNFRKAYSKLQIKYKWWLYILIKLLYPFRSRITINQVKSILNLEAIKRGEY